MHSNRMSLNMANHCNSLSSDTSKKVKLSDTEIDIRTCRISSEGENIINEFINHF